MRSPALSTLISLQCLPLCLLTVISGSFQARVRGEGAICPCNSHTHANINHDCLEINFFSRCTYSDCRSEDSTAQRKSCWYDSIMFLGYLKGQGVSELILVMMMLAMMLMSMQSLWPWCRWPASPPLSCSTRMKRGMEGCHWKPLGGILVALESNHRMGRLLL